MALKLANNKQQEDVVAKQVADMTKLRSNRYFETDHHPFILAALKLANVRWRMFAEPIGNGEMLYTLVHTQGTGINDDVVFQHTDRSSKDLDEMTKTLLFFRGVAACKELVKQAYGDDDLAADMKLTHGLAKYRSKLTDQLELPGFVRSVMNSMTN